MKNFRDELNRIGKYDDKNKDLFIDYALETEEFKKNAELILEQIASELNQKFTTDELKEITEIRFRVKKNVVSRKMDIAIDALYKEEWENIKMLYFFDDYKVAEMQKAIICVLYNQGMKCHLIDGSLKGFYLKMYM